MLELVRKKRSSEEFPITTEAALAQAWRDPARQAPPTVRLEATTVHPFGDTRSIGQRCAASGTRHVVDAGPAVLADQLGGTILTTDPADVARLDARHTPF